MEIQNSQFSQMSEFSHSNSGKESLQKNPSAAAEIKAWLISHLAQLVKIDPEEVDVNIPFNRYGLDSSAAIGMTGDLGEWLGYQLEPTIIYNYPTIEALVEYLSE